jgi:hypothetical protein
MLPSNPTDLINTENIRLFLLLLIAVMTYLNNKQGKIIHTLVNSKMTAALEKIASLEKEVAGLKGEK